MHYLFCPNLLILSDIVPENLHNQHISLLFMQHRYRIGKGILMFCLNLIFQKMTIKGPEGHLSTSKGTATEQFFLPGPLLQRHPYHEMVHEIRP